MLTRKNITDKVNEVIQGDLEFIDQVSEVVDDCIVDIGLELDGIIGKLKVDKPDSIEELGCYFDSLIEVRDDLENLSIRLS